MKWKSFVESRCCVNVHSCDTVVERTPALVVSFFTEAWLRPSWCRGLVAEDRNRIGLMTNWLPSWKVPPWTESSHLRRSFSFWEGFQAGAILVYCMATLVRRVARFVSVVKTWSYVWLSTIFCTGNCISRLYLYKYIYIFLIFIYLHRFVHHHCMAFCQWTWNKSKVHGTTHCIKPSISWPRSRTARRGESNG